MKIDPQLIERRKQGSESELVLLTFSSQEAVDNFEHEGFSLQEKGAEVPASYLLGHFQLAFLDEMKDVSGLTFMELVYEASILPVGGPIEF